jgi:SAM-dependent methyltransferase
MTCRSSHQQTDHDLPAPEAPRDAAEWDELYASTAQLFSGQPNSTLISEVSGLHPGRALDVGCGEGSDAVWLASQGWEVTALEVSQVALERATLNAEQAAVDVQWVHASLVDALLPPAGFDLVSAHYPALCSSGDHHAERALLAAVAPGGVLLMVYHAGFDGPEAKSRGINPADYVLPTDIITALLAGNWQVHIDTKRPREAPLGDAGHIHDVVLRARRLPC